MNRKIFQTLEFHKVLDKLAAHAATSLGKAKVEQLTPSTDLEEVKTLLQATDEAFMVVRLKGHAPFGGIRNVLPAVGRAKIGGCLNVSELLDIGNTIAGGRKLKRFLETIHQDHPIPRINGLYFHIADLKPLEEAIKACIDEQAEVLDHASTELARIRRELRAGENHVREKLEQMIRSSAVRKMLQESLITMRGDRYVIPVKQEYRASIGGIVHDQSSSGATLFIEPEAVVALNNKLRELLMREEKEIERILLMLSGQVAEVVAELTLNMETLAELDFIFAKAGMAHAMKATLPIMNDRGFIKIKKGRHPLIFGSVVPTDVELGNRYTTIIVTGPNTGGKTVTIKTIGLLNIMAMSGLFIPAEDGSQMCVFDAIYADIGDEQSIEQSLSTFSSHMTNIIHIINEMTPKSLVLLDELGAGTDPAEGSALAIAILEYMHRMGCRIVATTHYSELKAYAYDRKGIMNASMEFDIQTLSPTYRLLMGIPGRSNAFAIAERLGLSQEIIEHARGQVSSEDLRVDSMIATLEENRLSAESERQTAEQLRREVEQVRKEMREQESRFEQQRDKLLSKAEQEAREAVAKARKEAEEIISDLRKMALEEATSIKEHKLIEARKRLDDAEPELRKPKVSVGKSGRAPKLSPGDEVLVTSLGRQKGHVVELSGESDVVVQLGIMKMKVKKNDVEFVSSPPVPATKPLQRTAATVKRTRDENVRVELDLRGSNLEDSLVEVDRFLDEGFLSNLGQVYIIHGKGMGILRSGIQEYLRKHRNVKSYRLGNYGEGGTGVTVVEFK